MRKKMIMILTGTVLLAAVFIGVFVYQKQTDDRRKNKVEESKKETENSSPSRKEKEEEGQRKQQETEIRNGEKESRKEEKERKTSETMKGEMVSGMELSGFSEEVFHLLKKDQKELSEMVKQWMQENGFSSATGIEYCEPTEIRFQEKKCSISCKILFGEQGNGIHQESEIQLIFLDYFWEENLLQIHK